MTIDVREAKDLVTRVESLLDSLDKTFDSLPSEIDQKVKDAKLTLLNLNINNEKKEINSADSLDKKNMRYSHARPFYLH